MEFSFKLDLQFTVLDRTFADDVWSLVTKGFGKSGRSFIKIPTWLFKHKISFNEIYYGYKYLINRTRSVGNSYLIIKRINPFVTL